MQSTNHDECQVRFRVINAWKMDDPASTLKSLNMEEERWVEGEMLGYGYSEHWVRGLWDKHVCEKIRDIPMGWIVEMCEGHDPCQLLVRRWYLERKL